MSQILELSETPPDFTESAERLAMLRESAIRFCSSGDHIKRSRGLRGCSPGFDQKIWERMAGLGWMGILIPERFGGLDLGCMEMAAVVEALGRQLFPEPFVASIVLGAGAILYGDNETVKSEVLPAVVSGNFIPALAWRESDHQGNILSVNSRATPSKSGVRLSGRKHLIIAGTAADGFVVSAKSDQGLNLYWVPKKAAKARLSPVELADGRSAAILDLTNLQVPNDHLIAGPGQAEAALLRAYDEALVGISAELLGVISGAFFMTLDYLRTRKQFGKLIGCYQALQHRAVDLYAAEVTSRCTLEDAIVELVRPGITPERRGALASRVKARCSHASLQVTREAVQMHGAIGISDECDIGLFLKRAVTLSSWLGGAELHRRRYAELIGIEHDGD